MNPGLCDVHGYDVQPYDPYAHDIAQFDWRDSRDLTKQ